MGLPNDDFSQLPHFDWDKAKIFYYVAKFGNMSEAGKFLNLKQPSISRSIGILEDQLNCTLLIRHQSGVKLTRKGEELFSIVEDAFLKLKGFSYNQVVMSNDGQKRKLRISTTHAIATYVLHKPIMNYRKSHPHTLFEVITNDEIVDLVLNDVDMAIRPYNSETKNIEQEHLFTLEKRLYASPKYLEIYGEPTTVDELRNHHVIAHANPEKHPYADVAWILKLGMPAGELREPVYVSNSLECLVKAAQEGIGIISGYNEMEIFKDSGFQRILPSLKTELVNDYISYPSYLKHDEMVMNFKCYLVNFFKQYMLKQ